MIARDYIAAEAALLIKRAERLAERAKTEGNVKLLAGAEAARKEAKRIKRDQYLPKGELIVY